MPQKLDFSIKKGSSLTSCFCQHLDVIGGKSCFLRQIASQANQSPYLRYDSFWLLLLGIPSILLAKLLFIYRFTKCIYIFYIRNKKSFMYEKVIIQFPNTFEAFNDLVNRCKSYKFQMLLSHNWSHKAKYFQMFVHHFRTFVTIIS